MNRSQEEYIFKAFKKLYTDFPFGESIRGEQPDYIIVSKDRCIGLEITQIFVDNHKNLAFNLKRKENLRRQLGESLCTELSKILPLKFILSIDFSTKDFPTNKISQIVDDCILYFKGLSLTGEEFNPIEIDNLGQLPDEIHGLSLFKYHKLSESFYSVIQTQREEFYHR